MVAARKVDELVEHVIKPGCSNAEQLASCAAGGEQERAAHLVTINLQGMQGHMAQALVSHKLLKGRKLEAVGLDAGQAHLLGQDLVYDLLLCIRPLPAAAQDVQDVDVRLIVQAAGGDDCEIGTGFRAGGKVDERAELEAGTIDDGEFGNGLDHIVKKERSGDSDRIGESIK